MDKWVHSNQPAELSAFQESLPPEKRPKDAKGLARELILAKRLTKYQATRYCRELCTGTGTSCLKPEWP